jgi:hypothetical protein
MAPGLVNFKVIADPCRVTACKVHWMETDEGTASVNDRGLKASLQGREKAGFYSADLIQLNHYYTRSAADLDEKLARGSNMADMADNRRRVLRKVARIEAAEVEDRVAADWWRAHR